MSKYTGLDGDDVMEPITYAPKPWWADRSVPNRVSEILQVAQHWRDAGDVHKADFLERAIELVKSVHFASGYAAHQEECDCHLKNPYDEGDE